MKKILVVEDDKNSGYLIKRNLKQAGYQVVLSGDGEAGLRQFESQDIDLCILDIMLPKKDGLRLAQDIRKRSKKVPFIFLSARSLPEDRIEGLKLGCDDYITKPFNLEELLLRINVVLNRRGSEMSEEKSLHPIELTGGWTFHYLERTITNGVELFSLSSKEADLFRLLCEHKNELVSRSQILVAVWGKDDFYTSKSLDVFLTKIRKLVREIGVLELQNIHGYGYKLVEKKT